jgi:hypothetical protein
MLHIIARGCPSWTPVKGWQDLGGCWSPPAPPSYWSGWSWPIFLTHFVVPVLGAFLALVVIGARYVRDTEQRRR